MYTQTLYKILKNHIDPKVLKKLIGIKNGSMDITKIMIWLLYLLLVK